MAVWLLKLDAEQLGQAISITSSMSVGRRKGFDTMIEPFHPGKAASNGLLAAFLARRGYSGSPTAPTELAICWGRRILTVEGGAEGTLGHSGAAAVAGRLRGLSDAQMKHTLALVTTQVQGPTAQQGSMTEALQSCLRLWKFSRWREPAGRPVLADREYR